MLAEMSWKKKKEARLHYDTQADAYDELYSEEQRIKFGLALHRSAFGTGDRIIDCGCGTGLFLEQIAGTVQIAVGVDLSSKMLRRARLRLSQIPNINLLCADIDFLPFLEDAFDRVFMFTVLSDIHMPWDDTIKESLRVLRTRGIITLSVPKKESSGGKLLSKLGMNGLEPRQLIDDDTAADYVVVGEKSSRNCHQNQMKQSPMQAVSQTRPQTRLTAGAFCSQPLGRQWQHN